MDGEPAVHLDRRERATATARSLDAGAIRDLGNRKLASAYTGRGDAKPRFAGALRLRESHGPPIARPSVRGGAPVSSHTALAELSQAGRREPDPSPGVGRRCGARR